MRVIRSLVQGENVVCGLEFGNGYEADLVPVSIVRTTKWRCWCRDFYISIALIGTFDTRVYACKVSSELFRTLGINLHLVGHRYCCLKMSHKQKVHDVSSEISALREAMFAWRELYNLTAPQHEKYSQIYPSVVVFLSYF
jgi:hypothetical protein